mgnify:FL=1|tara:strand:- start:1215 stop:1574 length:360 start_codon:yes stop_codon:yes gene_type:complete
MRYTLEDIENAPRHETGNIVLGLELPNDLRKEFISIESSINQTTPLLEDVCYDLDTCENEIKSLKEIERDQNISNLSFILLERKKLILDSKLDKVLDQRAYLRDKRSLLCMQILNWFRG